MRKSVISAVSVFALGGVVLIYGLRSCSVHRYQPLASSIASTDEADRDTIRRAGEQAESKFKAIASLGGERAESAVLTRKGRLGAAVERAVLAYAADTPDAYIELLSEQGVEINPVLLGDGARSERLWRQARVLLALAEFDLDAIRVIDATHGGYVPEDRTATIRTVRRDQARRFLGSGARFEKAELVMPGYFSGVDGTVFDGTLVVQFTLNPEDSEWVITEIRMIGEPPGTIVVLPPV